MTRRSPRESRQPVPCGQGRGARRDEDESEDIDRTSAKRGKGAESSIEATAAHGLGDALGAFVAAYQQSAGDVAGRAVTVATDAIAVAANAQGDTKPAQLIGEHEN